MRPVDWGRLRALRTRLIASVLVFVVSIACGEDQHPTANPGSPSPSTRPTSPAPTPWTVVKQIRGLVAARFRSDYPGTFSLTHNCCRPAVTDTASHLFYDLDTGDLVAALNLTGKLNAKSHSIEFPSDGAVKSGTEGGRTFDGIIMGEGAWSFSWCWDNGARNSRVFVAYPNDSVSKFPTPDSKVRAPNSRLRIVPLKGDLPGIGLYNVVTPDGGFISIRPNADAHGGHSGPYALSVFRLKDAKVTLMPADHKVNPYWRWVGVKIPLKSGDDGVSPYGGMPAGAPERFTLNGRALAGSSSQANILFPPYWEWNLADRKWTKIAVPGVEDSGLEDAFYAGTCLFVVTQGLREPGLMCRKSDGSWSNLGNYQVLARNGGTHLIIKAGYSAPGALIVKVN
ncbi:MAG: hypothetical protein ACHQ50_16235 [Fimbriimonadales bacterium]